MYPSWDVETYSEGGFCWNAEKNKWQSPRGCGPSVRGLKAVGTFNYVTHPTFEYLSLAYDLLDGRGMRWWRPHPDHYVDPLLYGPQDLIAHVAAGRILSAFNVDFEFDCWNLHAVRKWGWPEWHLENARCDMAKAKAWALPGGLDDVGEVLNIVEKKDKAGGALVRKLTVPKNPSVARNKATPSLPEVLQMLLIPSPDAHPDCHPDHECPVCNGR